MGEKMLMEVIYPPPSNLKKKMGKTIVVTSITVVGFQFSLKNSRIILVLVFIKLSWIRSNWQKGKKLIVTPCCSLFSLQVKSPKTLISFTAPSRASSSRWRWVFFFIHLMQYFEMIYHVEFPYLIPYFFSLPKSHQSAWPFMEPVKRTEAPGYYEVIRFPMGNAINIF